MQQQIQFNLSYYVTSSFALLPLTGTTSIVAAVVGGVIKLACTSFTSSALMQAACANCEIVLFHALNILCPMNIYTICSS
jgi:hypothetical protein